VIAAVAVLLIVVGAVWASTLADPDPGTGASGTPPASQTSDATDTSESTTAESTAPSSSERSSEPSTPPSTSEKPAPSTTSGGGGGGDTTLDADNADDLLAQYHDLVIKDPAAAYEQVGPTLRNAISLQGFEDYWGRFTDVNLSDVQVEDGGDTALATMEFVYPDGSTQVERHRFTFVDQDGRLVLDSDRFVQTIQGHG
jgi:hypothetical protein